MAVAFGGRPGRAVATADAAGKLLPLCTPVGAFAAAAAPKAVAVEPATAVAAESAWLASQPSALPLPEVIRGLFEAVAVAVEGAGGVGSEDGSVDGPARLVPCAAAAEPAGDDNI